MPPLLDTVQDGLRGLTDAAMNLVEPTLRLGVTGLSRSGKTVFVTALVHALVGHSQGGARLPALKAAREGRLKGAHLSDQPDDALPRFPYEDNLVALTGPEPRWPASTDRVSQLRLVIEHERPRTFLGGLASGLGVGGAGPSTLTLDIVDYPGEWLLDLPLLEKDYATWAGETLALASKAPRDKPFAPYLARLAVLDAAAPLDEAVARELAALFTDALRACRDGRVALSSLPPGRFLMPGDLAGSPALTFAPVASEREAPSGSLIAAMARRYEAYKSRVVRPFFRDHFARLDRQVVLVDALAALSAGPAAVADLEAALGDVLGAFRVGRNTWLSGLVAPRVERVLFAATKADHLHHSQHDRLEAAARHLVARAEARARGAGARVEAAALAAVRATREARVEGDAGPLACVVGVPAAGARLGNEVFDGRAEAALYPGELPQDPRDLFRGEGAGVQGYGFQDRFAFLPLRPPKAARGPDGMLGPLPHIRLDRAMQALFGDRLG